MIALEAPAKVNLFLEVTGRRPDGYHELVTVMQTLRLADTLEAEIAEVFSLEVQGLPIPPEGENLVLKAARLLREEAGAKGGARFRLTKRIPAGAGLGGGSSDAAAALKACARLWGLDGSPAALQGVAERVGSDVPFFLGLGPRGGAALCTGRGERVAPLRPLPAGIPVLVVWPGEGLATRDVYGAVAPPARPRDCKDLIGAWETGDAARIGEALFNRLEEAALRIRPGLAGVRGRLPGAACMTGSGSAFFSLGSWALEGILPGPWLRFTTAT